MIRIETDYDQHNAKFKIGDLVRINKADHKLTSIDILHKNGALVGYMFVFKTREDMELSNIIE